MTNGMSCPRAGQGPTSTAASWWGCPPPTGSEHPLAGVEFQRRWEAAAYTLAAAASAPRPRRWPTSWPGGPPRPWGASPPPNAPASPRRSWTAACPATWPTPCGVPSPSSTASSAALPRRRPCSPAWRAAPPLRYASSGARTFSPPSGAFTPAARGLGTRAGLPARPWTAFGSPRPVFPMTYFLHKNPILAHNARMGIIMVFHNFV